MAAYPRSGYGKKFIIRMAIVMAPILLLYYFRYEVAGQIRDWLGMTLPADPRPAGVSDLEWCEHNYADEIAVLATEYDLSYSYLMALIVLECEGNKPAGHRFEGHVFSRLKHLQTGKRDRYENVRTADVLGLDDSELRKLATSWGPFQLMGYKAIPLGVQVEDLVDEETSAEIGVRWISGEYGHFVRRKKFKDAFHYHNTGKRFPLSGRSQTHDPYYVSNGIRYMKHFDKHSPGPASGNDDKR